MCNPVLGKFKFHVYVYNLFSLLPLKILKIQIPIYCKVQKDILSMIKNYSIHCVSSILIIT